MLTVALTAVLSAWSCEQEDARIRAHLEDALVQLQSAQPVGLSPTQLRGRAAALVRLREYIDAGRFPRNRSERAATPVFVDSANTHCAMGQLLSDLDGDTVVQNIRRSRNLETVPVLADEPGLASWLTAHGMTGEEAALVQPTYFYCQPLVPCGVSTFVHDVVLSPNDAGFFTETRSRILTDAGLCVGEPGNSYVSTSEMVWPPETVLGYPGMLADEGPGWVSWVDANCPHRPRITDAERVMPLRACIASLARSDLSWLAVECFHSGWQLERIMRCSPDGRYRSWLLPPRGTMRQALVTWLDRYGLDLADAGIDPIAYDALENRMWEFSDDGGSFEDAGLLPVRTWDGGVIPLDQACVDARDAGRDAGIDAGIADAGPFDAGAADAAVGDDAGLTDAGTPDAGALDAGEPDAGTLTADAGSTEPAMQQGCGCSSLEGTLVLALVLLIRRRERRG